MYLNYLKELKKCKLCPWKCKVNRFNGERGVCRVGIPEIAYTSLTYILRSYSITLLGCSFKCMYCNAYRISQYPDAGWIYRGYVKPENMIEEIYKTLGTSMARKIGVYRLSFTGGEPSIHLPYIEEVVNRTKSLLPEIEVGIATNGFSTSKTMKRLLNISSFMNFEIKAFDDDLHRNLTGAPVDHVLRNAEFMAKRFPEKIRIFRTVVIPGITDSQIPKIAEFINYIDPSIPYRIIGFRPNFMLYYHPGPTKGLMEKLVDDCRDIGLKNVDYSGYYPTTYEKPDHGKVCDFELTDKYLKTAGCPTSPRDCGSCKYKDNCKAMMIEPWILK